ncbi:MAG: hypothetical protein HQL17_05440 [Candidatus Omnitrophica bacterium]|nr:hypothetical protein [Candidatus Omnitrophota bacterium]
MNSSEIEDKLMTQDINTMLKIKECMGDSDGDQKIDYKITIEDNRHSATLTRLKNGEFIIAGEAVSLFDRFRQ